MYVPAIQAGINASEFWNSSIAEIEYRIAEYGRERDESLKQEIIHMFILAELFAERHPKIPFVKYPSNQKLTMPWDISPTLFAEEKEKADEEKKQEEFEQFKERRRKFYALHNKMRGGEYSE